MIVGQYYFRLGGNRQFSPSFPRGGLAAVFGIEVFELVGVNTSFECEVQHRNLDETTWSVAGTFASMASAAIHKLNVSDLREEVRLAFTVGGVTSGACAYANVLAPSWRPY